MSSDLDRTLRCLVLDGLTNQMMSSLTGVFFVTFALKLGASDGYISVLAAIPAIMQLLQLPSTYLISSARSRRKVTVCAYVLSRSFWFFAAALALFVGDRSLTMLMLGFIASSAFSAIGDCAWNSWICDLVPESTYGVFLSRRLFIATAGSLVVGLAAGAFVGITNDGAWSYFILFVMAGAIGSLGLLSLSRVPEKPVIEIHPFSSILRPFRDRNFRSLMFFSFLWNFALNLVTPFLTVYLLVDLGLAMPMVILLNSLGQAVTMVSIMVWSRATAAFGNRAVLAVSCPLYMSSLVLLTFTAMPQRYAFVLALLVASYALMGISTAGAGLALNNIVFELSPKSRATAYMAANSLGSSLGLGSAPIIGGFLVDLMAHEDLFLTIKSEFQSRSLSFYASSLNRWSILFFISFLTVIYALYLLSVIREKRVFHGRTALGGTLERIRRAVSALGAIGKITGRNSYGRLHVHRGRTFY